jgi:hypothetical protein
MAELRAKQDPRKGRTELLPDADPAAVKAALARPVEIDQSHPDAVWLLGDDPEANIHRISDRRGVVRRKARSEGAQFVYGLVVLAASLGAAALAATIRTMPFIVVAAVVCPVGLMWFRSRWRRWLGAAPYVYRLMSSLGEDAENILVDREERERAKYVRQIGDLYEHTRPKKT